MTESSSPNTTQQTSTSSFQWPDWYTSLKIYRDPSLWRATRQICNTLIPYLLLWALMILSIQHAYPFVITFILEVISAAFLVRIFILFHDCVHGSLFPNKFANTIFGHALGLLTFTPFDDWRFSHLRHHATNADLDARGIGDIWTLTQAEYDASSKAMQMLYRYYRNPILLVGLGALYVFILRFRLPTATTNRKEHVGVLFTNLLILGMVFIAVQSIGWKTYLLIQGPIIWMAGAAGIWLFYVQHQFKDVYWFRRPERDYLRAAMEGSSFYDLPPVLRWFSGNIGYHHIHHLNARIPNYRLKECYDAIPELQSKPPLTIKQSLSGLRIKLWDESSQKLIGFRRKKKKS